MKAEEAPQDNSKTYYGQKRLLYAQSNKGNYTTVQSSGWDVEEKATLDAVQEYERLAEEAKVEVENGRASPLLHYMYKQRMDLPLLAQTTGSFQWQVKRHFKPKVFARLSDKKLQAYSDTLGVPVETLKSV